MVVLNSSAHIACMQGEQTNKTPKYTHKTIPQPDKNQTKQTENQTKNHFASIARGTVLRKKGLVLEGIVVLLLYGFPCVPSWNSLPPDYVVRPGR